MFITSVFEFTFTILKFNSSITFHNYISLLKKFKKWKIKNVKNVSKKIQHYEIKMFYFICNVREKYKKPSEKEKDKKNQYASDL